MNAQLLCAVVIRWLQVGTLEAWAIRELQHPLLEGSLCARRAKHLFYEL